MLVSAHRTATWGELMRNRGQLLTVLSAVVLMAAGMRMAK